MKSVENKEAKEMIRRGWCAEPGMPDIRRQLENFNAIDNDEYCKLERCATGKTFYEAYTTAFIEALKNYNPFFVQYWMTSESSGDLLSDEYFNMISSGKLSISFEYIIDDDKENQTLSYSIEGTDSILEKNSTICNRYDVKSAEFKKVMSVYRINESGLVECRLVLIKKVE